MLGSDGWENVGCGCSVIESAGLGSIVVSILAGSPNLPYSIIPPSPVSSRQRLPDLGSFRHAMSGAMIGRSWFVHHWRIKAQMRGVQNQRLASGQERRSAGQISFRAGRHANLRACPHFGLPAAPRRVSRLSAKRVQFESPFLRQRTFFLSIPSVPQRPIRSLISLGFRPLLRPGTFERSPCIQSWPPAGATPNMRANGPPPSRPTPCPSWATFRYQR